MATGSGDVSTGLVVVGTRGGTPLGGEASGGAVSVLLAVIKVGIQEDTFTWYSDTEIFLWFILIITPYIYQVRIYFNKIIYV